MSDWLTFNEGIGALRKWNNLLPLFWKTKLKSSSNLKSESEIEVAVLTVEFPKGSILSFLSGKTEAKPLFEYAISIKFCDRPTSGMSSRAGCCPQEGQRGGRAGRSRGNLKVSPNHIFRSKSQRGKISQGELFTFCWVHMQSWVPMSMGRDAHPHPT